MDSGSSACYTRCLEYYGVSYEASTMTIMIVMVMMMMIVIRMMMVIRIIMMMINIIDNIVDFS